MLIKTVSPIYLKYLPAYLKFMFIFLFFFSFFSIKVLATGPSFGIGCSGDPAVESICPAQSGGATDAGTAEDQSKVVDNNSEYGSELDGGVDPSPCEAQLPKTQACCKDPTTCLVGEDLAAFNDLAPAISGIGIGGIMALQGGSGQDMSGLCKAMGALNLSSAGVTATAVANCKASISSCTNTCQNEININCAKYRTAQNACQLVAGQQTALDQAYNTFKEAALEPVKNILAASANIPLCAAETVTLKDLKKNSALLVSAYKSSKMCQKQASNIRNQGDCKQAKGTWENGQCTLPKEACVNSGGDWNGSRCITQAECQHKGGTWDYNNRKCKIVVRRADDNSTITAENKALKFTTEKNKENSSNKNPPAKKENTSGGGGGNEPSSGYDGYDSLDTTTATDSTDGSNIGDRGLAGTAGGGGNSSIGGLGSRGGSNYGYYGNNKKKHKKRRDGAGLNMGGGGGFSSYGSKGSNRRSRSNYGNFSKLKLSKAKVKKLEAKKGTKRKSDNLGAHESVFERIKNRYQSLCKNKLNCR